MKKSIIYLLFSFFVFPLFIYTQPQTSEAPLIPMRDFFRNPDKAAFNLSPNGEYLAFVMPWENRLNVHVQKIGSTEIKRVTGATERDISGYFWASNTRIVYIQDTGGDENFRLYAVDLDGSNQKDLTPFEKVTVQVIDDLEDIEDEMIIAMNKRNAEIFDVYRINIVTGDMQMIAENPGNITGWITDHDGKLRLAVTTDGVNSSILYRKTEADPFKEIVKTDFTETLAPQMFTYDNKNVYMVSNLGGRDKAALVIYDIENNKELNELYIHPEVDVAGIMVSHKRKVLTGVNFVTDKREYYFFDDQRKKLQEEIEAKLPGYEVVVANQNKNEDKALIRTYSDKSRGAYYYYDLTTKEFMKLADISPWINEENMADMKPVQFKSRDGLTIHGYLTLPKGVDPKNLPIVVNPHGGPWYRDAWGFNPEVQFLANRGYGVLQINFRGSTGYGKEFWKISFKQWGKTMQDDITDGVKWLVSEGIADPKKIGIYGGSYGGYATLAGLAFTPDLYACGVDYVGVANLFTFMKSIPPYWKPYLEMLYAMVGHPENDKELLTSSSPVFHVDKMKAPLLIAQGANDPRVNKDESDQMVKALKEKGIDVPYMVKDNEGHGFHNEENRFDFYGAMEQFLGKHLGGRVEVNN